MDRPKTASATAQPRPRIRLSLRWKAFGMLLLLLGVVHAFYGVYAFRQALAAFQREESERLDRSPRVLDELLRQSVQGLGLIGAQIAAGISSGDLLRGSLDENRISPELLASLSEVQIFDLAGKRLGGFRASGAGALPLEVQAPLLAAARDRHRPTSTLWCEDECRMFVFEPAFDHGGEEILIALSRPASEILPAFSRQSGVDVALLSRTDVAFGDGLLHRRLYAITNAPTLLPRLRSAISGIDAATGRIFSANHGETSLLLLLNPLPQGTQGGVYTLFVSDESLALERINAALRKGIVISLGGLLASSAALWWFLTPLSRRLSTITRTLPLLAEKRFADAAAMLGPPRRGPRLADEIDLLNLNARRLAQRLQQLDNAEAASAAKTRFLATLSHEVRTPLNGILGLLEVLQHSQLDPSQRESIGMVRDSAQSLLGVLDDTIDLARVEAGRIDLQLASFSIEQVVAGCAETAAPRARAKNLKLMTHTDPALPQLVMGDAMRLRQVLNNLCSNAVKFTASGRVVVRAELAGNLDDKVRVRFSVQDTGIGIPFDVQRDLFEPFQQGGGATTARYGGSGLGLSICQGLVKRMGGRIGFVSNPGTGSEFSFWLEFPRAAEMPAEEARSLSGVEIDLRLSEPDERAWITGYLRTAGAAVREGAPLVLREDGKAALLIEVSGNPAARLPFPVHRCSLLRAVAAASGLEEPSLAAEVADRPQRHLRVLAVDDHSTNRAVIQRQLSLLGHRAVAAADGRQALNLIENREFDLLLTDLRMPEMDGIELVRELRARESAGKRPGRLPALAISAQLMPGEDERCFAAGIDRCLTKPLALEELRQALAPWSGAEAPAQADSPKPSAGMTGALDRVALAQLLGGDDAMVDLLLAEFFKVNTPLVADLSALANQGNSEALAATAHRVQGSARTVGAASLAAALASLEDAARQRQIDRLPALASAAADEYQRVKEEPGSVSA